MALRGFGLQTLGATSQPAFGTQSTSPVRPTPDIQTGSLAPAANRSQTVLPIVANIFRVGDHLLLGPASLFLQTNTTQIDGGTVSQINTAANTVTVMGLSRAHNASEWAVLATPCAQVQIQVPSGNTGAQLYFGEDSSVAAGSATLIAQIPKGTLWPAFTEPATGGCFVNNLETQHMWVSGTAGDQYLPAFLTV